MKFIFLEKSNLYGFIIILITDKIWKVKIVSETIAYKWGFEKMLLKTIFIQAYMCKDLFMSFQIFIIISMNQLL